MSSDRPDAVAAAPAAGKRPRNAVEKNVVRFGIAVLVLLVVVQAHARFGYGVTLKRMQARLAEEEEQNGKGLLISELPRLVAGFPTQSLEEDRHWKRLTLSWRGLTQPYSIRLVYDGSEKEPAVLNVVTADAPEPPEVVIEQPAAPSVVEMSGMMSDIPGGRAGMGGMGGGGGGGRNRPDIMASDADGDGKVSREEASEWLSTRFDQFDANSDGFVDAEEVAAARQRRQQRGGGRPETEPASSPAAHEGAAPPANAEPATTPPPQ